MQTKKKIKPCEIHRLTTTNLNKTKSEKYGLEANEVEKNRAHSEKFRINFEFIRLNTVKKDASRKTKYAKKNRRKKK